MRAAPLLLLALLYFACGEPSMRTSVVAGPPLQDIEFKGELESRHVVDHPDALGISGSCADSEFSWLVAERNKRLLHLDAAGTTTSYVLEGIPDGLDLEGLACAGGRFYISTESTAEHRTEDLVLVVELATDKLQGTVTEVLTMHYPDGLEASTNQGLEGLCIAGDWLIAAGEIIQTDSSGGRRAPILRQKLGEADTFIHWLNLTSTTGKISGIDCRMRGDVVEVYAVERHFEIGRLLQFDLGDSPSTAKRVIELAHLIRAGDNFESLLIDDKGQARLFNDNQYKTITGPTEETVLVPLRGFARE